MTGAPCIIDIKSSNVLALCLGTALGLDGTVISGFDGGTVITGLLGTTLPVLGS